MRRPEWIPSKVGSQERICFLTVHNQGVDVLQYTQLICAKLIRFLSHILQIRQMPGCSDAA